MVELPDRFVAVDWRDFEEVPQETFEKSDYSDFFGEAFEWCFPDALAEEVFNLVKWVAHPYRRCFDSPAKSPRNDEITSAIKNKGKRGGCTFPREFGNFIVRPLVAWMFNGHLRRKHYYTSDTRVALPYFDVDCHLAYQTQADAQAARSVIEREFVNRLGIAPLFLKSYRGANGYLKVDLAGVDPAEANDVFDELQDSVRLLFAKFGLMADFEIKGTITWQERDGTLHAGKYGKLPMCADDWTYNWHRKLVKARRVTIAELKKCITDVKALVTPEDVARHEAEKRRAFLTHYLPVANDQEWRFSDDLLVTFEGHKWIARDRINEKQLDKLWPDYEPDLSTGSCSADAPHDNGAAAPPRCTYSSGEKVGVEDLRDEPDALVRQREALLVYARLIKRVPTVEEALTFIKDNGLYSGEWKNSARRSRVRGILKFIARTFDAKKCVKPDASTAAVNIGKYDAWAQKKFPNGLIGCKQRRNVTEDFEIVEAKERVAVSWQFISVFVSVCEYCLLLDKNEDGSLPHKRAKDLWNWLFEKGLVSVSFDDRKWAVCRDGLEKLGIIKITDRSYEANKAMKWAVAPFFPMLGLWKTKKLTSLGEPGDWHDLVINREGQHNSLLRQKFILEAELALVLLAQPPPDLESG
ncbi:MAG: hypothetical protein AB7I37_17715 [Pirellulales bacterium]